MLEIVGIVALVFLGISLLIHYLQEYAIFHPEKLGADFKYRFNSNFEEIYIPTTDGAIINALLFKKENSKGLVFYFKGNTKSIKGWGKFSRDFLSKDFDFFVFDYRGFGKSKGKRSERNFHKDGHTAYQWLVKNHYKEENIIIYGRSMGSGFAARVASRNNPKLLILDSPYYSLYHMAKRFLPIFPVMSIFNYHVRTDIFIRSIRCPIYIIHGTKDRLIPFRHSLLLAKLNSNVHVTRVIGAGHNNLPNYTYYHNVIFEILNDTFEKNTDYAEVY